MSMHKIPLTPMEESGLRAHGLEAGTQSQLSDAFRQGVAWARTQLASTGGEAVEVVAYLKDRGSAAPALIAIGSHYDREPPIGWIKDHERAEANALTPLMTVAQHNRIVAAMQPAPAGVVVDQELLSLAVSLPSKESAEANHAGIVTRGAAQAAIRALLNQAGGE